jgi:hypothetical protein
MEEEKRKQSSETPTLELGKLWLAMKKKKMLYLKVCGLTFVVVWLLSLGYPDYYKCQVTLVPESSSGSGSMGNLLSLASSFGVNLGSSGARMLTPLPRCFILI